MTTPTFNRFKSTTIYGSFNNVDYPDNSLLASAYFQRNLTISGDLTCSGIIYGKKLFYNNVDISSTFVSNITLSSTLSNYALSSALTPYALSSSLSNYANLGNASFYGSLTAVTPITSDVSTKVATTSFVSNKLSATLTSYANIAGATFTGTVNLNNGFTTLEGKDVHISCNNTFPTTNSGGKQGLGFFWNKSGGVGEVNLLCYGQGGTGGLNIWNSNVSNAPTKLVEFFPSGSVFSTTVNGITPATSDNSTQFATTAYVKAQNYAVLSGATFTGSLNATTQATSNNSTLVATTAYVKAQNYITSAALSPYALSSTLNNYALSSTLNNYALSTTLNNYALLSGATFTGNVSGLTASPSDNSNLFATTAFVKSQNYLTSLSASGTVNITQSSSTSSAVLQFLTDTGVARANIYSSFVDSRFCFDIRELYNEYGFEWRVSHL